MNYITTTTGIFNPQAYIAVKNNRVKIYKDNKIYLNDGDEFEIEFQNSGNFYAKAEITINGKSQNSALVLSPGQKFYLDRFMDEKKKFKFNVFKTGNDDIEELKKILESNGKVEIKFYRETLPNITWTSWDWNGIYNTYNNDYINTLDSFYTTKFSPDTIRCKSSGCSSATKYSSLGLNDVALKNMDEVETGRIESGNKSNQDFYVTHKQFETFPMSVVSYHILPKSQKKNDAYIKPKSYIMADESQFRAYCNNCGRRVKKGWQFCPGCGQKY